jgi:hypothetical protein
VAGEHYGLLLYTASPDAEGTLGGLVQQAHHLDEHLAAALHSGELCSNDPVCAQHTPAEAIGGSLAARRRLPRLRTHRRDLMRDAQRLPRPRAGRSDACGSRRRLLSPGAMIDALLVLPTNVRSRLQRALEAGVLLPPYPEVAVCAALGNSVDAPAVCGVLRELASQGVPPQGVVLALRLAERAVGSIDRPDLVWSGPEVPGLHARDTAAVYGELVAAAEQMVWLSTYAFYDGQSARSCSPSARMRFGAGT